MSLVRVVFLGTPDFACESLNALIEEERYQVVGVVSQPDRPSGRKMKLQPSPVKQLAQRWVLQRKLEVITPENVNTLEVLEKIKSWKADVAVVVAFGQIMSDKFLNLFPEKVFNVHASLLPRWRGAAPIQRALMAGDSETGVALQRMVKALDAGDVLGERKISTEGLDAVELHDALKVLGADLLVKELFDYLQGELEPQPQEESLVTYAKKISKDESKIDWSLSATEIHNRVRGLKLGPGSHAMFRERKIKIHKTEVDTRPLSGVTEPGKVMDIERGQIACGEGQIRVLEVQPESKGVMSFSDFARGYSLSNGDVLT